MTKGVFAVLIIVFIAVTGFTMTACAGDDGNVSGGSIVKSIELEGNPITHGGNPTTGYIWVCTISPEGVVREVSNEYIPDNTNPNIVGSGGKFVFTFEAVAAGEAELVFSYLRPWEEGKPALKTVKYKAIADADKNLTLTEK
jgi:predicted secreted protein